MKVKACVVMETHAEKRNAEEKSGQDGDSMWCGKRV